MKALIAAALLLGIEARAETNSITTLTGKIYSNAVIQRADADGLVIHYRPDKGTVGIAKVKFRDLDELTQKRFGYDPANALVFERNQRQATDRVLAQRDAAATKTREREYRWAVERRERNDLADQRAAELAERNRKQEEAARDQQRQPLWTPVWQSQLAQQEQKPSQPAAFDSGVSDYAPAPAILSPNGGNFYSDSGGSSIIRPDSQYLNSGGSSTLRVGNQYLRSDRASAFRPSNLYVNSDGSSTLHVGNQYLHSGGSSTLHVGNQYLHSGGSSTLRVGNQFLNSDGTSTLRVGNQYLHSDGTSTLRVGKQYLHSDGTSTLRVGY